jgi:glycosyltransferase involved in cell wall biosynthesis
MISGTLPNLRCGVGDYTHWLSLALRQRNIKLTVITSQDSLVKCIDGIDVQPIIKDWGFPAIPALIRSIKKSKADMVHIQYPTQAYKYKLMINFFPIFFKLCHRIPIVVTVHDAKRAHFINKMRLIPFIFFIDKIVVTAYEEKKFLTIFFPWAKSKFEVVNIGSNFESCKLAQEEKISARLHLGVGENEILIVHFGFLFQKKKIDMIFYALKRLVKEGYGVKLIVIGDFHPARNRYHAKLNRLIGRLNLNQYVAWAGYCSREEVSRYLCSSDICVQIYSDGVSFRRGSFLAALNHGLPIITTVHKTLPGELRDRHHLLAIPLGDIDKLVGSIKELIESPDLRNRLAVNARRFSERFSWDKIADKHIELYQGCTRKNR